MKRRILLLSLLPILTVLNAGCSRSSSQQEGLRQQQPTRELLDLKLKCAEVGRRFQADFVRDLRGKGLTPLEPRFAYNAKLNTCIYRGGSMDKLGSFEVIVDLTTNEELASYLENASMDDTAVLERAKFSKREMELFGPKPD